MQAMILAAGMGKRLGKYTRSCTKCMVRVGNVRLIDRMVAALKQAGIHKLIMVVGYEGEQLEAYLRETAKDMELVFIYNREYQKTNNIYSLFLAKIELEKMNMGEDSYLMLFHDGKPVSATDDVSPYATVTVEMTGTDDMWEHLLAAKPVPYYQCLQTTCVKHGMKMTNNAQTLAYLPAWNRMVFVLRDLINN